MNKIFLVVILLLLLIGIISIKNSNFTNMNNMNNMNNNNNNIKKDYAICIIGELRGVKTTVDSFYKNLVEPLKADIFILYQKTGLDIDKSIDIFNKNIIQKKIYDKPDSKKYFNDVLNIENNKKDDRGSNNWCYESCLQLYINFTELGKIYGDLLEQNYNYIIITRSDFKYLFSFPDIKKLTNNNIETNTFWTYNGHDWGGINPNLMVVPALIIKEFLSSIYNFILNPNLMKPIYDDKDINAEKFLSRVYSKYIMKKLMNINAFISADSVNERTTWGKPEYNAEYDSIYKYYDNFKMATDSYKLYKEGYKWVYKNNNIYLSK